MALDGRKIYIAEDWINSLILNIEENIRINISIMENNPDKNRAKEIDDAQYMIKKLNKYKKVDSEGKTYYYLFPNELELIMWILLENNCVYEIPEHAEENNKINDISNFNLEEFLKNRKGED